MTIAELMVALSAFPADARVFVLDDDTGATCPVHVLEQDGAAFIYGTWDERLKEPAWEGLYPP